MDSVPGGGAQLGLELVYDLRSNEFYGDVKAFSACVVDEIDARATAALDGYTIFTTKVLREAPRSRGEYALELLTLGMAIRLYGEVAARTPAWVVDLARELYLVRRRSRRMKPAADFLRAQLFQRFMRRNLPARPAAGTDRASAALVEPAHRLGSLTQLIEWLQSTGEFEQESTRLNNWRSYLRALPLKDAEPWIETAVALFDWFTREANVALGKYSAGVMRFLERTWAARFRREDQIFCGRYPVEYHLGMVAADVMNDGLREEFDRKPRKIVLVPTCMRGEHAGHCKARISGPDMKCTGCDAACTVNRITRRMAQEGVEVFMVPHASGFSRWLERWQNDPKVGIAAVACLTNILPGGYEMRARGIASQCVPLDYPGCERHWTENGISTTVNEERLVQVVRGGKE